jgi:hypothetical protein
LNQEEINQRFRRVREQVEVMANRQEEEIISKVEKIRKDTVAKFSALLGPASKQGTLTSSK